jgi:hypothetical protein
MSRYRTGVRCGLRLLALLLLLQGGGCTAGRVLAVGNFQGFDSSLKTIALAPEGGVFADLIGMALSEEGYVIIDTGATAALLVLLQRSADDLVSPQSLATFKDRGIDAVLITQKVDGKDCLPQTVHMRLYSTDRKVEVGGIDWENSWVRRGALEAAQEIAAAIVQHSKMPEEAPSVASQPAQGESDTGW